MTYDVQAHLDNRLAGPIPKGRHVVNKTLKLTQSYGYRLCGEGGIIRNERQSNDGKCRATTIVWEGPPDVPVLDIRGCTGLVVEGINILAGTASQGILIRDEGGSLDIDLRNIGVVGGTVGIQCGVNLGDSTCANVTYRVHCQEQRQACIRTMNLQSLEHLFIRPKFALAPIGIDVVGGGDVCILGGGSYEIGALLRIGNGGRNCRGYDVSSFRFDGKTTRTAWITYDDPTKVKTVGPVSFRSCSQNNGQQQSNLPLITVCPGTRVVCRECSFDGGYDNWARVYSHRYGHQKVASGELVVENCDGLDGDKLATYATLHGERAYAEFKHCGTLWAPGGSWSNFPDQLGGNGTVNPPQFTSEEADAIRELVIARGGLYEAADVTRRIVAGQLRTVLAEEVQ